MYGHQIVHMLWVGLLCLVLVSSPPIRHPLRQSRVSPSLSASSFANQPHQNIRFGMLNVNGFAHDLLLNPSFVEWLHNLDIVVFLEPKFSPLAIQSQKLYFSTAGWRIGCYARPVLPGMMDSRGHPGGGACILSRPELKAVVLNNTGEDSFAIAASGITFIASYLAPDSSSYYAHSSLKTNTRQHFTARLIDALSTHTARNFIFLTDLNGPCALAQSDLGPPRTSSDARPISYRCSAMLQQLNKMNAILVTGTALDMSRGKPTHYQTTTLNGLTRTSETVIDFVAMSENLFFKHLNSITTEQPFGNSKEFHVAVTGVISLPGTASSSKHSSIHHHDKPSILAIQDVEASSAINVAYSDLLDLIHTQSTPNDHSAARALQKKASTSHRRRIAKSAHKAQLKQLRSSPQGQCQIPQLDAQYRTEQRTLSRTQSRTIQQINRHERRRQAAQFAQRRDLEDYARHLRNSRLPPDLQPVAQTPSSLQSANYLKQLFDKFDRSSLLPAQLHALDKMAENIGRSTPDAVGVHRQFWSTPFALEEVTVQLDKHATGKSSSPGLDGVTWKDLKPFAKELHALFQQCYDEGKMPTLALYARYILIPKPGSKPDDPSSNRAIALESTILKLFTSLISTRMSKWMEVLQIVDDTQLGFIAGRSHEHNLLILRAVLEQATQEQATVIVSMLDIRKAFDSVNREALWVKLHTMGASGKIFDLLRFVYEHTKGAVFKDGLHNIFDSSIGVLQGDPLSPLLWAFMFADFQLSASHYDATIGTQRIQHMAFADDLLLISYAHSNPLPGFARQAATYDAQQKIRAFEQFCALEGYFIAADKCECIEFGPTTTTNECYLSISTSLQADPRNLRIPQYPRYLGLLLQSDKPLSFSHDLKQRAGHGWSMSHAISSIETFLGGFPIAAIKQAYHAHVKSILVHHAATTFDAEENDLNKAHAAAVRSFFRLPHDTPILPILWDCGILPLQAERIRSALRLYKQAITQTSSPLLLAALQAMDSLALQKPSKTSWTSNLRAAIGPDALRFLPPLIPASPEVVSELMDKCEKLFLQHFMHNQWRKTLTLSPEGRPHLPLFHMPEPPIWSGISRKYLNLPPRQRFALMRLRYSHTPLRIQSLRGFHPRIDFSRRGCRFCLLTPHLPISVETEEHIFLQCNGNNHLTLLRDKFWPTIQNAKSYRKWVTDETTLLEALRWATWSEEEEIYTAVAYWAKEVFALLEM